MAELTSIADIVKGMTAHFAPIPKVFKCLNCSRTVCNLRGVMPKQCKNCFAPSERFEEIR